MVLRLHASGSRPLPLTIISNQPVFSLPDFTGQGICTQTHRDLDSRLWYACHRSFLCSLSTCAADVQHECSWPPSEPLSMSLTVASNHFYTHTASLLLSTLQGSFYMTNLSAFWLVHVHECSAEMKHKIIRRTSVVGICMCVFPYLTL